jgi:hypothetical protein
MCFTYSMTTHFQFLNDEQVGWVDEIVAFCNRDTTGRFEGLGTLPATVARADSLMCDRTEADLIRACVNHNELVRTGVNSTSVPIPEFHALASRVGVDEARDAIRRETELRRLPHRLSH